MYAAGNREEKVSALLNLKRFTYMQCLPKISQRLNITLHPYTAKKFLSLFFGDEAISASDFRIEDLTYPAAVLTAKVLRYNETRFINIASKVLGYDAGFELDSEQHIVLDNRTLPIYHKFIGKVVQEYYTFISNLLKYRSLIGKIEDTRSQVMKVQQAGHALVRIDKAASLLADLVNRSSTFRRYLSHAKISVELRASAMNEEEQGTNIPQVRNRGMLNS